MRAKWKGYLACIVFLHLLWFQTWGRIGEYHIRQGSWNQQNYHFLLPINVATLQSAFCQPGKAQVCFGRILWIHCFCFTFHFSVNGKGAMPVFSLRWDPTLKMLRNAGTWSVLEALRLFSVYVAVASNRCKSWQIMSGSCNIEAEWKEEEK